jgi:GMP reductase
VYPGDVAKAFGAGAHFVMLGGMLAGHDESGGKIVDGKVTFYGMSSNQAMAKHGRRKDGYRGAEGKTVQIPYRGAVQNTITEILGGVRSSCTYIGAERIKDMPKCATFVRCTQQINTVFGNA